MKRIWMGAVVIAGLCASMSARATDRKIYPGTSCYSLASGYLPQYHEDSGAWKNLAGVTIRMMCPITRDQWGATTDMSINVYVDDEASGSGSDFQVRCWAFTVSPTGTTFDTVFASTSDVGIGFSTLTLNGVTPGAGQGNAVLLSCSVPNNNRIMSYQVTEAAQTD